ncbi:putative lipoprotein YiaD [Thalassocella blandensis]|nr:putative lipoprotein YiaD [Thalassocella blandensis]
MFAKLYQMSVVGLCALFLVACASNQETSSQVNSLQQRYDSIAAMDDVNEHAPIALEQAKDAVALTAQMEKDGANEEKVAHQAKLATLRMDIVEQKVRLERSDKFIADAESNRKDILLQARTNDAIQAQRKARAMENQKEQAEMRAETLENKAKALQDKVKDIETRTTARGTVLSLNNIVFELNKAELAPGNERTLEKISAFLNDYPKKDVIIEGHTDSTGEAAYNKDLSKRRAESVKDALVGMGVNESRLSAKGMGEKYPVASNETREGRQLNRRVDIVVVNEENEVAGS